MTLLAFVMMIFVAQLHGAKMAVIEADHMSAQMQSHDSGPVNPQCAGHGSCFDTKNLCDVVCSSLPYTILPEAYGAVTLKSVSTRASISGNEALDGIRPALDQRPPILLPA